ncbi:protein-L-isoaspartate O-methyltransferase [Roseateles sp. BYS180W]|uniref:Protein-L-isoaspartate O-methyltransferase n=1 Tax=Roseateles rivi TaxID=3299028 RepID=A0ABW7FV70_9BURK
MNFEQARFNMIEQQIRPWDVLDSSVLELLSLVRREDFVPAALRQLAFVDTELPLSGERKALAPRVEARMLQALKVLRHEKVLEIGTGMGYLTALLSHKAQHVHSVEADAELAAHARESLRRSGCVNVTIHQGPAQDGVMAEAPFDAVLLCGSVAEVPQALLDQVKVGGRLLAVVGEEPAMQLQLRRRTATGWTTEVLLETVVARLPGLQEPATFTF